jgi:hypothetical protein
MTAAVPAALAGGGLIGLRQTTFWDVHGQDGSATWRVSFRNKLELCFVEACFTGASLVTEHPLLHEHEEPEDSLFISSPAADPDRALLDLDCLCQEQFRGWRPAIRYLNPGYPARRILTEGSGMLLRGPRSFVEGAADVLARAGIRVAKPDRGKHRGRTPCALLLGRNFVIAESFEFESI